ncbi:MAG: TerB family tellurite resistance protein [Candidatus Cloacimonadia bacterium]
MKRSLRGILGRLKPEQEQSEERVERRIQIAACVLLVELAGSDEEFTDEERERIIEILKEQFDLSDEEVRELIDTAQQARKESVDLWQFTNLINQNFSEKEKIDIVENAWRVVYADGKLSHHEDYVIHKISNLLRLSHTDLINAKLRVGENEKRD